MFLLQLPNIFSVIVDINGEETVARMFDIAHLDDEILFSSWTEEGPLLVSAASEYARNQIKYNPIHDTSFYMRGRGLLRE